VRRLIVVNALIFAVLAAAAALAYYGYSATIEQTSRERELALMQDLAEEKVQNIESLLVESGQKLMREVKLDDMASLKDLPGTTGAAVVSVYVLDDQKQLVPDGFVRWGKKTPTPAEGVAERKVAVTMRDWFLANIVPILPLDKLKVGERGHLYLNLTNKPDKVEGKPYLFSFMKRVSGNRTFYVVIEDDLVHLWMLFQQFFTVSNKRLYQIVDENGVVRYGEQFVELSEGLVVRRPFIDTVGTSSGDGWELRVAQRDLGDQSALARKRIVNSFLIGGAVTVILAGLAVLGFAIRRERRLNELKSEFISNVSHELKTPLSIISMFGEMLAEGRTKSPEQAHEYAEIIWRESVRLGRLIDNVLDFAKIERGMGSYEFSEDTDLAGVVETAVDLSSRRVAAADMRLESHLEPDLPLIELDQNAFTLAVLNLIDNAIKYAPEGKKIELDLKREGNRIVLSVRDFGAGIDPEEHERIFDRFYRARAIRLKPIRGSGIGLALVQHIARAHGGEATVESEVGKGSTFRIWLPIDGKR
jgi:two-component system phosphate regulon sensor histidine kinase PhoR